MTQHTKDKLADALRAAGLDAMACRAAAGYYHDFLSPLETPSIQLSKELSEAGTPEALTIRKRHHNGEFDASTEEGDDWAASHDGQEAYRKLAESAAKRRPK